MIACCFCVADARKTKTRHRKLRPAAVEQPAPGIHLKLIDGSSFPVDEAWESAQGVWYQRGGISHLISRERVKAIERGVKPNPGVEDLVVKVAEPDQKPAPTDGPAWIYLIGGARVEADNATESAAGVWYRRGSLSIFVERARGDHIEREAPRVWLNPLL